MQRRQLIGYSAAVVGALCLALFAGWWRVDGPGAPAPAGQRPLAMSEMDFRLTDHQGKEVDAVTLIGRPSLVFFGFTYCPDICPTTLSDISVWLSDLGDDAGRLNVIFITVDPERDTVAAMAAYISNFHPIIQGWTGSSEQIARAVEGFRANSEKVPTGSGDYTMNHTASVFLFDANGRFVSTIDYHEPREYAVPKIRRAIDKTETG